MIKKTGFYPPMKIKTLLPGQLCILSVPSSIYTNGLGTEETRRRYGGGTEKEVFHPGNGASAKIETAFGWPTSDSNGCIQYFL